MLFDSYENRLEKQPRIAQKPFKETGLDHTKTVCENNHGLPEGHFDERDLDQ